MDYKKYDRERESADVSTRLTYLLIGGGIGAVIALLFAPKPGRELRGDIADATRKGIDRTRETASQLGTKAGEYYGATKDRATELYSAAADKAGELKEAARDAAARQSGSISAAIEAGKQAYTEEKRRTESSGMIGAAPGHRRDESRS
jgi:gas vesicle protein